MLRYRNLVEPANYFHPLPPGLQHSLAASYYEAVMPFPMKTCAVCGEVFELKPDKPGFANKCLECTEEEQEAAAAAAAKTSGMSADERREKSEMDAARRETIRNMLYRKES